MNEIHDAAIAYYNNGTEEQQAIAASLFHVLDTDRSGRVSLEEYSNFLCGTAGLPSLHPEMFRELDRNGDGELDFWEVMTIYYVAKTRTISCRTCQRCLIALYFTCVTCFDSNCDDTFDLCVGCYMKKAYSHEHSVFLDSYVLLRSRRKQNQVQNFRNVYKKGLKRLNQLKKFYASEDTILQEDPQKVKPSNVPQDITHQVNHEGTQETNPNNGPQDITLEVNYEETEENKPNNVPQDITLEVNYEETEETNPSDVPQEDHEGTQETNNCNVPQDTIPHEDPQETEEYGETVQNFRNVPQDTLPEEDPQEVEEVEEAEEGEESEEAGKTSKWAHALTALDVAITVVDVASTCSMM